MTNSSVASVVVADKSAGGGSGARAEARTAAGSPPLPLASLDLSRNSLTEVGEAVLGEYGARLRALNVSHNSIRRLRPVFGALTELEVLDLSDNRLDEDIDSTVFTSLPESIKYLDISSEFHGLHRKPT